MYTEVGRGGRLGGCWKCSSSVCLSVLRVRSAHPEAVGRLRGLCKVREYPNGVSG